MRIDMAAGQLHSGLGAALEGDVGEFDLGCLLDHPGQHLIGVLGLRATHLELGRSRRLEKIAGRLVGRVLFHPQQELVLRHGGDRGEIGVVEGDLGDERLLPRVRGAEDHLVGIARGRLAVDIAFRPAAAALVDDHDRLIGQLVFGDDALDGARKIIGAAAGPRRCDELDWLLWLPGGLHRDCAREQHRRRRQPKS